MQSLVKLFRANTGAKAAVILLIITMLLIAFATTSTSAPGTTYGDVTGDGKVDVRDVVLVMQYVIGLKDLTADQFEAADVNGDGVVNVQDVTMIMRHVLRIESFGRVIESVEKVEINVFVNNPADRLYFPGKVLATLNDGSKQEIKVRWEDDSTPSYIKEEKGEYGFEGALIDIPWGITNPSGIKATATVYVLLYDDPSYPHPRPDFGQHRLILMTDPVNSGITAGGGNYQEGEFVQVSVEPAPGFEFINWTEDGTVVSTDRTFSYRMPARDVLLTANLESTWPIEMDGLPIISYVDLGDFYAVTIVIKDEYVDRVSGVTILGKAANQDPNDLSRWRTTFDDEVTLDDLRGQIVITVTDPDEVDVVDSTKTTALFVDIFGNDISVRVYLKANETATSVTADGIALSYSTSNDRWQGTLFGYDVGDNVEVVVVTADGQQTVNLEVEQIQ